MKKLVLGKPYFTDTKTNISQNNYLDKDIDCDIAIIGGGIDGLITAYYFSKTNQKVVLIDKSRLAKTSTSVATALLEYQLDSHAHELKKYMTETEIIAVYQLGLKAISDINSFIKTYGNNCHFSLSPTLIYTQKKCESKALLKEYKFRKDNGFNIEYLNINNNPFNFNLVAGLFCEDGGAQLNPYLFSKQLYNESIKNNVTVYENTECLKVYNVVQGAIIHTQFDHKIKCKKAIICTGYDTSLVSTKPMSQLYTSYSLTTNKIKNFSWHKNTLLHDNSNPYHYIRPTHDKRIIIGGEDTRLRKKISKSKAKSKYKKLEQYLYDLFPQFSKDIKIEYKFCGAFGVTDNNLGVVGFKKNSPNIWYNLGYGANGIINCVYGAQMLVDLYEEKQHPYIYLYSPDRKIY